MFTPVLLLCSLSWISAYDFHSVEVKSGETVTLLCSNYTSSPTQVMWFRAVEKMKPRCISSVFGASEPASFCEGADTLRFEATASTSTLFLKIKRAALSDSGLYFCGSYISTNLLIVGATYLEVRDMFKDIVKLTCMILGALTAFLWVVVIGQILRLIEQHKAHIEELHRSESQSSDDFEYPMVTLGPRPEGDLKAALARELETDSVYDSFSAFSYE